MNELVTIGEYAENQDQMMNDIIQTKGNNLPATIEDVVQVFEFTDFKAKAFKIMADKCKKLDDQSEIYHSALRSGQKWGIATLYSQKRMGEITRDMPKKVNKYTVLEGGRAKGEALKNNKLNFRHVADAEQIAKNPEILDRVIKNAEERGEIPTKTAVLNTIRVEKARERETEKKIKNDDKLENRRSKSVSDYYEAMKEYKQGLDLAIIAGERGKFDESGKNFMIKKHDVIRSLMEKLEELI